MFRLLSAAFAFAAARASSGARRDIMPKRAAVTVRASSVPAGAVTLLSRSRAAERSLSDMIRLASATWRNPSRSILKASLSVSVLGATSSSSAPSSRSNRLCPSRASSVCAKRAARPGSHRSAMVRMIGPGVAKRPLAMTMRPRVSVSPTSTPPKSCRSVMDGETRRAFGNRALKGSEKASRTGPARARR